MGGQCHVVKVSDEHREKRQKIVIARVPKYHHNILFCEVNHLKDHLPHPRESHDVVEECELQEDGNCGGVLSFRVLPKDLSVN